MGDRERKDIHLSLSPELLYKAGELPPDLRQMFKSSSAKKVLLFWPGCLLQTQKHLVNPSITGLGELSVLHPLRPSPAVSSFPPSLLCADTDRHSLVGHAAASPQCIWSSAYLESICLLPRTDPEIGDLSETSLSVSFMYWDGGQGPREEGLGDGEVGEKREG